MYNLKKGAMFGLDARIALAIFGALSVISGAALYSAIENSKVIAIVSELNELAKAYDAYYLDTATELEVSVGDVYMEVGELISSVKAGWSGPYVSYELDSAVWFKHNSYAALMIEELKDGTWTGVDNAAWTNANCVSGSIAGACFVWMVVAFEVRNAKMIEKIDKYIDGSVDGTTGRVRTFVSNGGFYYALIKHRASDRY